jgi:hypothetical protein
MRIGVLESHQVSTERPNYHLKKSVAESLVARGHAVWVVEHRVIQKTETKAAIPTGRSAIAGR